MSVSTGRFFSVQNWRNLFETPCIFFLRISAIFYTILNLLVTWVHWLVYCRWLVLDTDTRDLVSMHTDGNEIISNVKYSPGKTTLKHSAGCHSTWSDMAVVVPLQTQTTITSQNIIGRPCSSLGNFLKKNCVYVWNFYNNIFKIHRGIQSYPSIKR